MKILFDHQIFSYQRYGGVSKYFAELLKHIPSQYWDTTLLFSNNEYIKSIDRIKTISLLHKYWFRGQGRLMNELNKPFSLYKISKGCFDVFHQTHYETYCLKALKGKPMVTTFHDMNFATYNKNDNIVSLQKKSIKRADVVVAISNNTKKDLIDMWKISPEKIVTIYHGVDSPINTSLLGKRIIYLPYILYVGRRPGFKNFERFVRAFALISEKYRDIALVCTSEPFSKEEIILLNKLNIMNKTIHIKATEFQMANLYHNAEMFVYPSIYEGFGLPILEAMSYDCPTILANASCFPEIAENASVYFDPLSIDGIYEAIKSLLEDSELKSSLIHKGRERVKLFSWEKTSNLHLQLYKSLT